MPLDSSAQALSVSQAFVHYSLFVSLFALGAAFVFFLSEKERVPSEYRGTMTTSAMICGVAAIAYYFLATRYRPDQPFPTDIRYVDWTVTTPLLLLKYHEMLKVRGYGFIWRLILADLFMIVTGFIGELYGSTVNGQWTPDAPNGVAMHYIWGLVSTLGYAYILYVLVWGEGKQLAAQSPAPIQHGIKVMNRYIWSLWGVYPVVYILEAVSATHPGINLDWGQTISAVADVINKAGFGVTAYLAVRAVTGDTLYSPDRTSVPDRGEPVIR